LCKYAARISPTTDLKVDPKTRIRPLDRDPKSAYRTTTTTTRTFLNASLVAERISSDRN